MPITTLDSPVPPCLPVRLRREGRARCVVLWKHVTNELASTGAHWKWRTHWRANINTAEERGGGRRQRRRASEREIAMQLYNVASLV